MHKHTLVTIATMIVVVAHVGRRPSYGGTMSYELGISTDLSLLQDPTDPRNQLSAAWKTSSEIAVSRETPLFRLTNTSQDANITGISISLNDLNFVFDATVIAESPRGLAPTVDSPLDTVQGQATSPVVSFSFADRPLRPLESFAFWVDIDPMGTTPVGGIDYRDILWHRAGDNRGDNALVHVTFDSAASKPVPFFEFSMSNRSYDSSRDDGTVGRSLVLPLMYSGDHVGAFFLEQTMSVENQPLPEPGGLVLLVTGLGFLAVRRRRQK